MRTYDFCPSLQLLDFVTRQSFPGLISLFQGLHELSMFLNLVTDHWVLWNSLYADRVYALEHRISTLLGSSFFNQDSCSAEVEVVNIFLTAGLLFIYTNLRQTPIAHGLRKRLVSRVKHKVAMLPTNGWYLTSLCAFETLWVLGMTATADAGLSLERTDDAVWLQECIHYIVASLSIDSWDGISKVLCYSPVFEQSFGDRFHEWWNENILLRNKVA